MCRGLCRTPDDPPYDGLQRPDLIRCELGLLLSQRLSLSLPRCRRLCVPQRPDLILCDLTMFAVDGVTVLREVRRLEAFQGTAFIMLSANDEKSMME